MSAFGPDEFGKAVFGVPAPAQLGVSLREPAPGTEFEALPDPFARIGEGAGPATLVLGRLVVPGVVDRPVAFAVERDGCVSGSLPPLDDTFRQNAFTAHHQDLLRLAEDGAPTAHPLPLAGPGGSPAEPAAFGAVYFCKRRMLFFAPPCPRCGEELTDCRDDRLLSAHGLLSRESGSRRLLSCPRCGVGPGPEDGRFFSCVALSPDSPLVGDRWELVRAWGARVRQSQGVPDEAFPCAACSYADGCYPEGSGDGEALRLLVPFSFYGFRCFVVPHLPLRYPEYCDLVGGQPWEGLRGGLAAAREFDRLAALDGREPAPGTTQLLFAGEPARRELEVLFLKLSLFQELCRGAEAVHRGLGRGHFNLHPAAAWVGLGEAGPSVPAFWNFELRLGGLGAGWPTLAGAGANGGPQPPLTVDASYAHPSVVNRAHGAPVSGKLGILSLSPSGAPAGTYTVSALLSSTSRSLADCGPRDRFRVRLDRAQGFRRDVTLDFALEIREREGLRLRSAPLALEPGDLAQFETLRSLPHVEVACSVDHWFGPECDLYSLGMMLFRALLVNENQREGEVLDRCRSLSAQLGEAFEGTPAAVFPAVAGERLRHELRAPLFHPRNVLFAPTERGGEAIPWDLWEAALGLAFRLTAGASGVTGGAPGAGQPWAALAPILEEIAELRRRAERALFAEPVGVDRDLRGILEELLADPGWVRAALAPRPEPATSPPTAAPPLRPPPAGPATEPAPQRVPVQPQPPPPPEPPDLESTVILRRGGVTPGAAPSAPAPEPPADSGELDPEATMILRPGGISRTPPAPPSTGDAQTAGGDEDEDMEKTMIIRPGARPREK